VGTDASFARVGVVGAGALGLYYGARLAAAGAEVRLLARSDLPVLRARATVLVENAAGTAALGPVAAFATSAEVGPVDLAVVALKTTSAAQTRELVAPLLGPQTAILTLQNGLGADEHLGRLFGAERVLGGLAFMSINRTGPAALRCFHEGFLALGELGRPADARTRAVADRLLQAGLRVEVVDNLDEARWRKLVWNVPFNGLAIAGGGITTDRICGDARRAELARILMVEVQQAAAAFGHVIPDAFIAWQFEVTRPMGAYRPSSLVDFLAGRPVEVEAIWGEPLRRAAARGIRLPALESLYHRLLELCPPPADG
jgi:2-dehydropantoate 2-reductase